MNFSEFLVENWKYISIALVILMDVIILLVKRNKTIVNDSSVVSTLVAAIADAEKEFGPGTGSEKLKYVIDRFYREHPTLSDYNPRPMIEFILSLPQKK